MLSLPAVAFCRFEGHEKRKAGQKAMNKESMVVRAPLFSLFTCSSFSSSRLSPLSLCSPTPLSLSLTHARSLLSLSPQFCDKKTKTQQSRYQLDKANAAASRWRSTPLSDARRRSQLDAEVADESRSISWQLDEVSKAVEVAAADPARFGLSPKEVEARRRWVSETRASAAALSRAMSNSNSSSSSAAYDPYSNENAARKSDDAFLGRADGAAAQVLARQDAQLDDLGIAVSRIGEVGLAIHGELQAQGEMLDSLSEDVDTTSARLAAAQAKVQAVLAKAGVRGQLMIIVGLIVALVVLSLVAFG